MYHQGDKFSIPNLLRNTVPDVSKYLNSSIGVFRLAPQDYHRWHSPVDGTIVATPQDIDGGLFTVNPMAVRRYEMTAQTVHNLTISSNIS